MLRTFVVVAAAIVSVVILWIVLVQPGGDNRAPDAARSDDAVATAPPARLRQQSDDALRPQVPAAKEEAPEEGDATAEMDFAAAPQLSWEGVDLDAVRAAMPDNLYWKMSSPTQDEAVIAERAAERDRWNVEYGKVLSGTGTAAEVRAYYDHRAKLFGDYVEFTSYLLDHYEATLPAQDVRMLKLARGLSLARLEEMPRKVEESLERQRAQAEARAAWLADQEAFGDDAPAGKGEDDAVP